MTGAPAARGDILALASYQPGAQIDDTVRLNANEVPLARDGTTLNRYPQIHPVELRDRMADLFGAPADNLLVTRGSSEAIDVLIRAWCRAYQDSLVTTPPTFEMYRVYADIQGAALINVSLDPVDFSVDADAVIAACEENTRLVFLCSPNNPTGNIIPQEDVLKITRARAGHSLVVVDEAYVEFSDQESLASRITEYENLVVLRTLSKAHGLAGARCGAAIAAENVIDVMSRVLPPYSFPTPVIDSVMSVLTGSNIEESAASVSALIDERDRIFASLDELDCVASAWPSQSNFILARFKNLPAILEFLRDRRILIRDASGWPELDGCARITIGTQTENDALLNALKEFGVRN